MIDHNHEANFVSAVTRHAATAEEMRLDLMQIATETGAIKMDDESGHFVSCYSADAESHAYAVNAYGSFIWGPPLAERIADGDPRGENRRRLIKLARSIQANRVQQKMNTKSRIIR